MVIFTIDNYRIEKRNIKTNSNYNVAIDVYKDGELFSGYHDISTVKDLDIIKRFVNSIEDAEKRSKATTLEEYFAI